MIWAVSLMSLLAGIVLGVGMYHRGLAMTSDDKEPLSLYGKKYYLIPADDLSAELWAENDELRRTLAKVRETVTRNFDDDRLGQIAQVAASLEDEDVSDLAFSIIEVRMIFAQHDKVF